MCVRIKYKVQQIVVCPCVGISMAEMVAVVTIYVMRSSLHHQKFMSLPTAVCVCVCVYKICCSANMFVCGHKYGGNLQSCYHM